MVVKHIVKLPDQPNRPMVEGKLVLIECQPTEAKLWFSTNTSLKVAFNSSQGLIKGIGKYFKPLVISEKEPIEIVDWVYYNNGSLQHCTRHFTPEEAKSLGWFKVLVLPEQFSLNDLQMIANGHLTEGDKVLLECYGAAGCWGIDLIQGHVIIHLPNGNPTTQPILFTLEEVKRISVEFAKEWQVGNIIGQNNINQWFEENVVNNDSYKKNS